MKLNGPKRRSNAETALAKTKPYRRFHITPLASLDLTDRKQFLIAAHYTNLRPLLMVDHKRKSACEKVLRHSKRGK